MGVVVMPGTWSRLMYALFDKFEFVVVYLDGIRVFSNRMEEHVEHLRAVCEVLRREQLYAHLSKCSLGHTEVAFLRHTVSEAGVNVDPRKTESIAKYLTPTNRKHLLSFLGLAGYCRRFIYDFAELTRLLRDLTKASTPWNWSNPVEEGYCISTLQQAPILKLPDFQRPVIVTTDASGHCIGGVLSQKYDGADHPIAFYSKKLDVHERGWPTHEKELLVIKVATEKWSHYRHGRPFNVYTDNSACSWMLHHPRVSPKMARFVTHFSRFELTMHHLEGKANAVADDLLRPPWYAKDEEEDKEPPLPDVTYTVHECDDACEKTSGHIDEHRARSSVLRSLSTVDSLLLLDDIDLRGESRPIGVPQQQINTINYRFVSPHLPSETKREFQRVYANDPAFKQQWSKESETEKLVKPNGLLYFRQKKGEMKKLRTDVIMECRDGATSSHPGGRRTYLKAAQWYYRPTMDKDIREYVRTLRGVCTMEVQQPEEERTAYADSHSEGMLGSSVNGLHHGFTSVKGYATIFDQSMIRHTGQLTQRTQRMHHGLPKVIISDRDSKFLSDFWKSLMKLVGVKLSMTTAHIAHADGQTERQNVVLEDALRCMVSYHGDDWVKHLGTIEYAHSTLVNASTKMTPFEVDTGRKVSNLLTERMKELVYSESDGILAEFAKNFALERQQVVKQAQGNVKHAQERQKAYYDRQRRQVVFKEGDLVLLDTKNLPLKTVNKNTELKRRLDHRAHCKRQRGEADTSGHDEAYHPTFNIELLSHYLTNRTEFPNRPIPKAVPIILDDETGEELYIIEKLLNRLTRRRKREWLVKWHGLPEHEAT
ncbi:LOW QUALITY PROTEIN: Retrotransposon nucleocapsid protein [Phytophthora palmivora]|uniref:Retrotransposon nucleocapsid protein n=1 Tax=Phytophthora palmivora TaxID=4796 RepID=A0A2P4YT24_9STRA|nr:LOW QUALITY PROTEIN: Retrotransposon nucleocapsid protein [Phytophthora palmivora]